MLRTLMLFLVFFIIHQVQSSVVTVVNHTNIAYKQITIMLLAENFERIRGRYDTKAILAHEKIEEPIDNVSFAELIGDESLSSIHDLNLNILVAAMPILENKQESFLQVFKVNDLLDRKRKNTSLGNESLQSLTLPPITVTINGVMGSNLQMELS